MRKIIQITAMSGYGTNDDYLVGELFALCDDGSLWSKIDDGYWNLVDTQVVEEGIAELNYKEQGAKNANTTTETNSSKSGRSQDPLNGY